MFKLSIGFDLVWKILFTYMADIDALDIIDTRGTVQFPRKKSQKRV